MEYNSMEEEIDLREYINILIRYWYWIAGLALVAGVVAFVVTSLQPIMYEATAVVVVTQPPYLFQFSQQGQTVPFDPAELSKSYPTIATSDEILLAAASSADPPLPPDRQEIDVLREMIDVETDNTTNLIKLTVRSQDPEEAAGLANAWARQVVNYLNDLYGRSSDLPLFESQMAKAQAQLEQMDQTLNALRREYGLGFLGNDENSLALGLAGRLQAKTELLTGYEARADQLAQLLQEARALAAQADDTTSPAILSGLLVDMLQLGLLDEETTSPAQISLGGLDARASLSALVTALEAKQSSIDETITQLTGEVATLQAELADKQGELDRLLREREVTQNTFLTLSGIIEEADIEAQDEDVQLLSQAAVPQKPAGRGRLRNTAVAGVLGLMAGVFGAFFVEYWRQAPPDEPSLEQRSAG